MLPWMTFEPLGSVALLVIVATSTLRHRIARDGGNLTRAGRRRVAEHLRRGGRRCLERLPSRSRRRSTSSLSGRCHQVRRGAHRRARRDDAARAFDLDVVDKKPPVAVAGLVMKRTWSPARARPTGGGARVREYDDMLSRRRSWSDRQPVEPSADLDGRRLCRPGSRPASSRSSTRSARRAGPRLYERAIE